MKTQQVILTASIIALADLSARRFVGFDGNLCRWHQSAWRGRSWHRSRWRGSGKCQRHHSGGSWCSDPAGAEVQATTGRAIPKAAGISNGYAWDAAVAAGDLIRIVRGI
jgi:hypothetical protein